MVVSEGGMTTEKWLDSYHRASFEAGKRGPQAMESSGHQELEKERKQILSQNLQNGHNSANTLILTCVGLQTCRSIR